jgi:hypothetical protein
MGRRNHVSRFVRKGGRGPHGERLPAHRICARADSQKQSRLRLAVAARRERPLTGGAYAGTGIATPGAAVRTVSAAALVFLVALGALGAWAGGAPSFKPALRVGFLGALAMAAAMGALIGKAV